jgi:hypothetical protein
MSNRGKDAVFFLEVTKDLVSLCGMVETKLKDEVAFADVEKAFDELALLQANFSPRETNFAMRTVNPNDSSIRNPAELRQELEGRLKSAIRALDEAARLIPQRRTAIEKLIASSND